MGFALSVEITLVSALNFKVFMIKDKRAGLLVLILDSDGSFQTVSNSILNK